MAIRTLDDIKALETLGYDAVYPHKSPWEILKNQAALRPDAVALRYLTDARDPSADRIVTFANLAKQIMGAARLFRSCGVTHNHSVAILAQHTPSAQVALWGAQIAGRACPINPMLKPEHIAGLIRASDAAAVVAMGTNPEIDYWATLIPALRRLGINIPIFACDAAGPCPGADGLFEDLVAQPGADITPEGDEHAFAAFYHTGGTTGAPKLVRHTRLNESHVAQSCAMMHDLGPGDVMVNGFPLFHVAGAFVFGLSALSAGASLVIPGRLGMRNAQFMAHIWGHVERLGITTIGAVPTVLSALKGTPVDADITSLRWLLTGGSPLPTELAEATEAHTGVPVRNILGMTESAGTIAVEPVHSPRTPLSCGLRLPFTQISILGETEGEADPEKPLPPGHVGIIAQKGPNIAAGYTDPARNAGTFLPSGWLISGDLGTIDDQGRLFITGRKKDVIIRGAHNIDPQMIEDALLAHPRIENAAAVGMPDAYAGELPVAFISTRDGWTPEESALEAFLRDRIADPTALPKRIAVVSAMPLTPIGKIFKPDLRAKATRWAIEASAERLGISVDITIDERLSVLLRTDARNADRLKQELSGMPIDMRIESS